MEKQEAQGPWRIACPRLKVPPIRCTIVVGSYISVQFVLRQTFWVSGHFETSAPNYSKMILDTTSWYVLHIRVTVVPEYLVSIRFCLRSVVFELEAILRQLHLIIPNDLEHYKLLKVESTQSLCYYSPRIPKFYSVVVYDKLISSYRPVWDKSVHQITPKMTPKIQVQRYSIYVFSAQGSRWGSIFARLVIIMRC